MIDYDSLVPNYTIETALLNGDIDDTMRNEVFTRLMIVIKAMINKKPVLVTTTNPDRVVLGANQEFIDYLGYSVEELKELDGEDIFDERDYEMIHAIGQNNLSGPYIVRVVKKNTIKKFVKVLSLSINADTIGWRFVIFTELDVSLGT